MPADRFEIVARAPTPEKEPFWRGEGTQADSVFTPLAWRASSLGALLTTKACLVFSHSTCLGGSSDSKGSVLQVLFSGILCEFVREARRREGLAKNVPFPDGLQKPFVIVCMPADWDTVARQDATAEKCRIWTFAFNNAGGGPPVHVSRSWKMTIWQAACYMATHCTV